MHDFRDLRHAELQRQLRQHVDGEVRFDESSRVLYSTDASIYQIKPTGVVIPRTAEALRTAVRIALELRIPVTARGGGTSLSGQSIGPGLIIDCSKYLDKVLEVDPVARTARVQPGVVLDQFNRTLAPYGLQFAPDPSTASRANVGGMIGNNTAGAHSIIYGKTIDHVRRLEVVLSDGSQADFGPVGTLEWDRRAELATLEGKIYRLVREVVAENTAEIDKRFPKILRRVSGYNLDALVGRRGSLKDLIVGSEGTLTVLTEAEVSLVPLPKVRGLLVPQFDSLAAALDAVATCLEFRPSAVELMDQMLIDLSRGQRALSEVMKSIPGRPAALLMVEFCGEDKAEVSGLVHELQRRLSCATGLMTSVPALEQSMREPLWNLRRAAMPLLYGIRGDRKPATFVEDAAVAPAKMPEFIARFREILKSNGTEGAFYGHASVGCLHIRPLLNLHSPDEIAKMRRITESITDLVLEFGGALTGEHGDGLARSEWNVKMFGPTIYEAFRRVKGAFDPLNLFNPGKVVNAPAMTENLRYDSRGPIELPTVYDYGKQEGFFRSIEICNGSGVCRKTQGGTMCPSFRATRDERDSTRGRANALRHALTQSDNGNDSSRRKPDSPLEEGWIYDVMSLCLECKACKTECPSNVDMAKLKSEFLNAYYRRRHRPPGDLLAANVHRLFPWASKFASIANGVSRGPMTRRMLEMVVGIDRRRSLPRFYRNNFRRWFERERANGRKPESSRSVILLDDCFTTFTEPNVSRAAVRVFEAAGCRVELAGVCCGRALISKGCLPEAREMARQSLPVLAARVRDGTPLLGVEPSCLLTVADDWPELVPGEDSRIVANAAELADHWLGRQVKANDLKLPLQTKSDKVLLHGHCHQKALRGVGGSTAALRLVPGLNVVQLETGCCGMAGSFGYDRDNFDISAQIANLDLLPALRLEPDATVAAPGTSCRHQIKDLAHRHALHPLEILANSLQPVAER